MLCNRKLNDKEAYALWQRFGEEVGLETLRESYGTYWPRKPLNGELVYEWSNEEFVGCPSIFCFPFVGPATMKELVGWSSFRKDILEPVCWINLGIFPNQGNKGYSQKIFQLSIHLGFKTFPEVDWCWIAKSKKSTRRFHFLKEPTDWIPVGEILVPEPGYTIFGIKREV